MKYIKETIIKEDGRRMVFYWFRKARRLELGKQNNQMTTSSNKGGKEHQSV